MIPVSDTYDNQIFDSSSGAARTHYETLGGKVSERDKRMWEHSTARKAENETK